VALANAFRAGLGLGPSDSAIVRVEVADAASRLERAGIRASTRAGFLRASYHLYNTEEDVEAAVAALT
jgi:selenocysteine lyase/cysteine desulfurase